MRLSQIECNYLIDFSETKKGKAYDTKGHRYQVTYFELYNEIKDIIVSYCKDILKLEISRVNVGIIKCEKDSFFGRHQDRLSKSEFTKDFLYNINVRLNDDYKGGEFYLDDSPYHKPVGEIYHYKSSQYHEVKKITEGVRYTAIFYIRERDIIKDLNNKNLL